MILKKLSEFETNKPIQNKELEETFQEIIEKNKTSQNQCPIRLIFGHKKTNSVGLQIADLVAYPIGRHILRSRQEISFGAA